MFAARMDFRPGGVFYYCLRSPAGQEMWDKLVYREIVPPKRIALSALFPTNAAA